MIKEAKCSGRTSYCRFADQRSLDISLSSGWTVVTMGDTQNTGAVLTVMDQGSMSEVKSSSQDGDDRRQQGKCISVCALA